jgi:putative transposase
MTRPLRIEYAGAIYHVTSRGNARQDIYLDDEDRLRFLRVVQQVVDRFNWRCHAYCLFGQANVVRLKQRGALPHYTPTH